MQTLGFISPFYKFYQQTDSNLIELSDLRLSPNTEYTFRRLNNETNHPFYISDAGLNSEPTSAIAISGDGDYSNGIRGVETFNITISAEETEDLKLTYYCTSHASMQGQLFLREEPSLPSIDAPSTPQLIEDDFTDNSHNHNLIKTSTPTFTGTAEPELIIEVFIDDNFIGSTQTNSNGIWIFTVPDETSLPEGLHAVKTIATSADKNSRSEPSSILNLTVDTVTPEVEIDFQSSRFESDQPVEVWLKFSEPIEPLESSDIIINGGVLESLNKNSESNFYRALLVPSRGAELIELKLNSTAFSDEAGNTNTFPSSGTAVINFPPMRSGTASAPIELESDESLVIHPDALLGGIADQNGDILTINSLSITKGNAAIVESGENSWLLQPEDNWSGTIEISFRVVDTFGASTDFHQAVLVKSENTPPEPIKLDNKLKDGLKDTPLLIKKSDLLSNYRDVDGDQLSITSASVTSGTLSEYDNNSFQYIPDVGFFGRPILNLVIEDGRGGRLEDSKRFLVSDIVTGEFNLDVDGDEKVTALGDGLMIIRKLFGGAFNGDQLTKRAAGPECTRSSGIIDQFISVGLSEGPDGFAHLDVDKDGSVSALGDGLMIVRHLFGGAFAGDSLINRAISSDSLYLEQNHPSPWLMVAQNIEALMPLI